MIFLVHCSTHVLCRFLVGAVLTWAEHSVGRKLCLICRTSIAITSSSKQMSRVHTVRSMQVRRKGDEENLAEWLVEITVTPDADAGTSFAAAYDR